MSEWISVKDRLPNEDAKILYVVKIHGERAFTKQGMRCFDGDYWWWCNEDGDYKDTGNDPGYSEVTHWQPLPDPPSES
jgi:hypothetical protein